MDKILYRIAAGCSRDVYTSGKSIGKGIEISEYCLEYNGYPLKVLAIAGTNEFKDWKRNIDIFSWQGMKNSYRNAALKIGDVREARHNLLVTGHSMGAGIAICYESIFGAYRCVGFAPPPVLRPWTNKKRHNTTLFIDPDDPVSDAGGISFDHPDCKVIYGKDDPGFKDVDDHFMKHWVRFTEDM